MCLPYAYLTAITKKNNIFYEKECKNNFQCVKKVLFLKDIFLCEYLPGRKIYRHLIRLED